MTWEQAETRLAERCGESFWWRMIRESAKDSAPDFCIDILHVGSGAHPVFNVRNGDLESAVHAACDYMSHDPA